MKTRQQYANLIAARLESLSGSLQDEFRKSGRIRSFIADQLLPQEDAQEIYRAFPPKEQMVFKNSIRERKYVASQMNHFNPILEEIIFAFQSPEVVNLVSKITGFKNLIPDEKLYAGGISLMTEGDYLNPHLDNSHDLERINYRVLNLLYYVTPGWQESFGGNLELWDEGIREPHRTAVSQFNRLVVMETAKKSWHSVSPVKSDGMRCCVSNYFFSPHSVESSEYFHVTSFRGRPENKMADTVMRADAALRNGIRFFFKKGIVKTNHLYRKASG